jgi:hypothetical protein
MMSDDSAVPRAALWLGLYGLLPSIGVLGVMLVLPEWRGFAAWVGVAYGAVIASFVGGAWWGLACARAPAESLARHLLFAIVPSLVAWPAVLVPPATGYLALALLFLVLLPMDRRLQGDGSAPPWWLRLRRPLSLGMAGLHAVAAVVVLVEPWR